ncbi:hypothetical protein ABZS66_04735 [Dactylosporangium sp. NPDC005572]|uniref:hypothetical protein n=1 Tax=Dactylosporangium sp. NPDC005572 TaxID=3156889 RepID=UPI0033A87B38
MPRNMRRRLRRSPSDGDAPETVDATEPDRATVRAFAKQKRDARRWADRMVQLFWLGFVGFLGLLFTAARFPAWLLVVGPLVVAVSATAGYGIRRAELVAPNRFPVRYQGRGGPTKGAPFMWFIAVFAAFLTVRAVFYVFD